MAKPQQIRDHIAHFLQEAVKAYDIDAVCDRLGMPVVEDAWTYNSKRVYVQKRLAGVPAVAVLTDGLAAPTRSTTMHKMQALVARQPGIGTVEIADPLHLPRWYVAQSARYLWSHGELARRLPG